jgi:hypothetical protein
MFRAVISLNLYVNLSGVGKYVVTRFCFELHELYHKLYHKLYIGYILSFAMSYIIRYYKLYIYNMKKLGDVKNEDISQPLSFSSKAA